MFAALSLFGVAIAPYLSGEATAPKEDNRGASQGKNYLRPLAFDQEQNYQIVGQTEGRNKRIRTRVNAERNGLQPNKEKATPYGRVAGPFYNNAYIQPDTWKVIHENTRNAFIEEGLGQGMERAWLNPMPARVRVARSLPWMQPDISTVGVPTGDNTILSPYVHDAILGKFHNPRQILNQGFVSFTDRTYNPGPSKLLPNHYKADKALRPLPRSIPLKKDVQEQRAAITAQENGLGEMVKQTLTVPWPSAAAHHQASMQKHDGNYNSETWDKLLSSPVIVGDRRPYE